MKKTITIVLILVLTVCLMAGCRRGTTAEDMATQASEVIDDMMPKRDNGNATDGDGFIGGNQSRGHIGNGGMIPNNF